MESSSHHLAAFELRLQELELPHGPAEITDFCRPIKPRAAAQDDNVDLSQLLLDSAALAEGLTMLPRRPQTQVIPLFDEIVLPLPMPEPELLSTQLSKDEAKTAAWHIEASRSARIAWIPRAHDLREGLLAVAALPVLLLGTPALANNAEPAVQRPKTVQPAAEPVQPAQPATPALPLEPTPVEPAPVQSAQPAQPAQPTQPPALTETPQQNPEIAPTPPTPPAEITEAPGRGVPESMWQAMKGLRVKLIMPQGVRSGRLAAVDGPTIVFIDSDGGRLYSVPKLQVMELRGIVENPTSARPIGTPDPNLPSGTGLIFGGTVATVIGTPFFISAVVIGAFCPSCYTITLPLLAPGLIGLGGGIPMLVFGARRRKAWNKSKYNDVARLSPSFSGTRQGWTGSLTLRF